MTPRLSLSYSAGQLRGEANEVREKVLALVYCHRAREGAARWKIDLTSESLWDTYDQTANAAEDPASEDFHDALRTVRRNARSSNSGHDIDAYLPVLEAWYGQFTDPLTAAVAVSEARERFDSCITYLEELVRAYGPIAHRPDLLLPAVDRVASFSSPDLTCSHD